MNFYKHFLGDYARDTAHLSMLEHGAYRLMLDHYYATGTLPADKALAYRICKAVTKAERSAVDLIADAFFPVNGDGSRHNKRADKEIGQWTAQAEINRELGKRGGRPRKTESVSQSVNESEPKGKPNRNPSHSHSQKPEITKVKSRTSAQSAKAPMSLRLGEGQVLETIPLVGEAIAEVCQTHLEELERLYPGVDPLPTLREIRGWNLANPARRKTARGIASHINAWFQRDQNRS